METLEPPLLPCYPRQNKLPVKRLEKVKHSISNQLYPKSSKGPDQEAGGATKPLPLCPQHRTQLQPGQPPRQEVKAPPSQWIYFPAQLLLQG